MKGPYQHVHSALYISQEILGSIHCIVPVLSPQSKATSKASTYIALRTSSRTPRAEDLQVLKGQSVTNAEAIRLLISIMALSGTPAKGSAAYKKKDGTLTLSKPFTFLTWLPHGARDNEKAVNITVEHITSMLRVGETQKTHH